MPTEIVTLPPIDPALGDVIAVCWFPTLRRGVVLHDRGGVHVERYAVHSVHRDGSTTDGAYAARLDHGLSAFNARVYRATELR